MSDDDQPGIRPRRHKSISKLQRQTAAGVELIALLQTIADDGQLVDMEVAQLQRWLAEHRGSDLPAVAFLLETVERILADGAVTPKERRELYLAIETALPRDIRASVRDTRVTGESIVKNLERAEREATQQVQRIEAPSFSVSVDSGAYLVVDVSEGRHDVVGRSAHAGGSVAQTVRLGSIPFAVVDVETTGLFPNRHDRVVEIAIVRMDPARGILDEYVTLVNPQRDVGPTRIHGIRASDVSDAPGFAEIAGSVSERLQGTVVVAHNARFDSEFLRAEFDRIGIAMPRLPTICTMALSHRLFPGLASRKLQHCCAEANIPLDMAHSALHDARATAMLFGSYFIKAWAAGLRTPTEIGCDPSLVPEPWCSVPGSLRVAARKPVAVPHEAAPAEFLASLVERLPPTSIQGPDEAAYLDLLERCLADRLITDDEADELLQTAQRWGLTRAQVFEAHHKFLAALVAVAGEDRSVSPAERRDLDSVASLLGLHRSAVDVMIEQAGPAVPRPPLTSLHGLTVCFTGDICETMRGEHITRDQAEALASRAGMFVRKNVSKQLDLLVLADTDSLSGKAKKARAYGVRMMAAAEFWSAIGVVVDPPA